MFTKLIEPMLLMGFNLLVNQYRDECIELLKRVGDKLNDRIEGSETQLDDAGKQVLIEGLDALIGQLRVEGVDEGIDGPVVA